MPYEYIASTANPRLLILLTDESEESVKIVNNIIDIIIQKNFDGVAPKNRCFISVIGYNRNVKDLCSGWLKELDASPLRYETLKKKLPDGAGGLVEVEVKQPIWVNCSRELIGALSYVNAIELVTQIAKEWVKQYSMAPIIVDCSINNYSRMALDEIEQIKRVNTEEGNTLFWGCYSMAENTKSCVFSDIPDEWKILLRKMGEYDTNKCHGVLDKSSIYCLLCIIFDCAEELGVSDNNLKNEN